METMKIMNNYDLQETIAAKLFEGKEYPWEVLPFIHDFILELGETLSEEKYEKRGEDIWIAKNAKVVSEPIILKITSARIAGRAN